MSTDSNKTCSMVKKPKKSDRCIVLDTETTGVGREDHIIYLSSYEFKNGKLNLSESFNIYIYPRKEINKNATIVNHLTNKNFHKDDFVGETQNLKKFLDFVGESLIFSHRASFDSRFLNRELIIRGLAPIPIKRFRCTEKIFLKVAPIIMPAYVQTKSSLEKCCEFFGITTPFNKFHDGMYDAKMVGELLEKLIQKSKDYNI